MSNTEKPRRRGSRTAATAGKRTPATASTKASRGYAPSARKGKFNANGEQIDGIWFASGTEAERYLQLKEMEAAGRIEQLRTQVTYELVVNGVLITRYRADFTYEVLAERGERVRSVIEDVKGMVTPEFRIKHKLFDALMPVKLSVIEVKGKARHSTRPQLSEKTGNPVACNRGWMDLHWKNRIPD